MPNAAWALLILAAGSLATAPASAFDCAKAREPIEKAICADPAARASDQAMEAAFAALRAAIPEDRRKAALDNQRQWLKQRNQNCANDKTPAACVARSDDERIAALTVRPESGPGLERRPVPYFVNQAGSRDKVEVDLRLFDFADPATPGERLLNAAVKDAIAKVMFKKDEPDDSKWSYGEAWQIAYASPAFLSVWAESYDYSGGAHGAGGGRGFHIDMRQGRTLTFADLFDAKAEAELTKICLAQVKAQRNEKGADEADDASDELANSVRKVVKNLANWSFKEKSARVEFGLYSVGPYVEGVYECNLPIEQVNKLSKLAMPLR